MSSRGDYTCMGSGLAVLDVIFRAGSDEPKFMAGGSCCNVLTILSYLGWKSFPVVRLGCDVEGDRIVEDMMAWGVQDKFIERDPRINTSRIIQRTHAGENPRHVFSLRCVHGRWLPDMRVFRLDSLRRIEDKIPSVNVFYFDRAVPSALEIAKRQKQLGALVVFEPPRFLNDKNFRACLEVTDIFKHCSDVEPEDYGCARPPLEIQTRGRDGLRYRADMLSQTEWTQIPALDVDGFVDASGSGDWLTAGLIHALMQKRRRQEITEANLRDSLLFGQSMATLNCLCSGARGLMYRVTRRRLKGLIAKVLSGKGAGQTLLNGSADIQQRSKFSSRCRICLCR